MGHAVLCGTEIDRERPTLARQEKLLRVIGVQFVTLLITSVPPSTTSSAISPTSGAVGSGVTVAVIVLPVVV